MADEVPRAGGDGSRGGSRGRGRGRGKGDGAKRGGRRTRADFGSALTTDEPAAGTDTGPSSPLVQAPTVTEPSAMEVSTAMAPSQATVNTNVVDSGSSTPTADEDAELCFICAEPIKYYALGQCSHRLCHVCSIRLRALYQKTKCTFCQTELTTVIFTNDPSASFESYSPSSLPYSDPKLSISCETREQLDSLLTLLRFNCPHSACSSILSGWADLKRHTRAAHGLVMCDLCTRHKKIFAHEHTLFAPAGVSIHMKEGEVGVGKGEEGGGAGKDGGEGFTGHPRCDFCGIHFYDADLLYAHCRDRHEQCFICVRNEAGRWQYYLDYNSLEAHFRQAHHLCPSSTCLEKRFIVFEHAFELQSHQVSEHGTELGKGAMQAARRLETHFTYSSDGSGAQAGPSSSTAGGEIRRGGRRGGGGGRTTGGAMSITPVGNAAANNVTNGARTVPGLGPRRPERARFGANLTSEDEAMDSGGMAGNARAAEEARHATLMSKVQKAFGGSETKVAAYKSAVRTYRNSEATVAGFVDTLWRILGESVEAADEVIVGTAELMDSDEKRKEVLDAWMRFQVERNNFPSLSGEMPTINGGVAPSGPRPAQARSGGQRNPSVWARVEAAAQSRPLPAPAPRERFPVLSKATNWANVPGLMPRAATSGSSTPRTAWSSAASTSTGSGLASSARSSPVPAIRPGESTPRYNAQPPPRTNEASFPSLPTNVAVAERQARVREALAKSKGRVDAASPPAPGQWGPSPPLVPEMAGLSVGQQADGAAGQAPMGKKPKKVLLYTNSVR